LLAIRRDIKLSLGMNDPIPSVAIVGAGAIGGQFAVRLMQAGTRVAVLARGATLAAIRRDGLALETGDRRLVARPDCADDPAALGPRDVVVVAVKAPALASAIRLVPALSHADTRVVLAINGLPFWFLDGLAVVAPPALADALDPGGVVRAHVPAARLEHCVVYSGAEAIAPGVVRNTTPTRNRLVLGRPDGAADAVLTAFAAVLRAGGFEAETTATIRREIWAKLYNHLALSPIAALTGVTNRGLVADPALRAVAAAIVAEIEAVGRALGLDVPGDAATRLDPARHSDHRPSLLQDLEAGRPLELATGVVALVALAAALGVGAPTLETATALVVARARVAGLA
jgi:2-dehydropantoate 2-reductase